MATEVNGGHNGVGNTAASNDANDYATVSMMTADTVIELGLLLGKWHKAWSYIKKVITSILSIRICESVCYQAVERGTVFCIENHLFLLHVCHAPAARTHLKL